MKVEMLLSLSLLLSQPALSKDNTCDDFECLSKHSIEQYRQDHQHWWNIYYSTSKPAKKCKSVKKVKTFLLLWKGKVDGEMASAYHEDIEDLIYNFPSCFFTALDSSEDDVKNSFLSKWCPIMRSDLISKLEYYVKDNPSDIQAAKTLIHITTGRCVIREQGH